jgi:hypothetical protein
VVKVEELKTPKTPEDWASIKPSVWWGIDPRTGLPASFSFGEYHSARMNVLMNVLLPSDPTQEWHRTSDGGKTWGRVETLTDEILSKTQVLIR